MISSGLTTTAFKVSATVGGGEITLLDTAAGANVEGFINYFDLPSGKIFLASAPVGRIVHKGIRQGPSVTPWLVLWSGQSTHMQACRCG